MKPPYRIPTMEDVRAIPWNGLTVASTFSGCGGSCTGYRMAGYRVAWANEFVPAAQDSYRANADTFLDDRDVRAIKPEEILERVGMQQGELDLFDGSPPCQAFSTAGKRAKGWGKDKKYEHGASQKNETLFTEYVRLLRGLMPRVFVAENVSGLVKGVAKGFFLDILRDLKASGYRVVCRVLDAQWLGVPQKRQRTIFVGVREDLGFDSAHPEPLSYRYSVRDAIPWIGKAVHDTSGIMSEGDVTDEPSPTVLAGRAGTHFVEAKITGRFGPQFQRREIDLSGPMPAILAAGAEQTRFEIDETNIDRFAIASECDKLKQGEQSDKHFNLVRTSEREPCPTVLASHGSPGIASPLHPTERRKFTIAELKRICSFPDDFVLTGSYAQQWERLGNSVPPLMMRAVAEVIRDKILLPARASGRTFEHVAAERES